MLDDMNNDECKKHLYLSHKGDPDRCLALVAFDWDHRIIFAGKL